MSSESSLSSFSRFRRRVCTTGMVSGWWYLDTKGNEVNAVRPISLLDEEGKIFWGVLARCMTNFLMSNHYINTFVQKAGIPGFSGCLEHWQIILNLILSAKRDKTKLHIIWFDLANVYGSVPHLLLRMAIDFFTFPIKVREIIMT